MNDYIELAVVVALLALLIGGVAYTTRPPYTETVCDEWVRR